MEVDNLGVLGAAFKVPELSVLSCLPRDSVSPNLVGVL